MSEHAPQFDDEQFRRAIEEGLLGTPDETDVPPSDDDMPPGQDEMPDIM